MYIDRNRKNALELLKNHYRGPLKYAEAVLDRWSYSDVLVIYNREPVGAEIFYKIPGIDVCIHYYIVVMPQYRKRGIATLLVKSVEAICVASTYLATTTEDNTAAMHLFQKLGYTLYRWNEIERRQREILLKATCGYDDDVILIKGEREFARNEEVEKLWRDTCLSPYLAI